MISGFYFDGKTARAQPVRIDIEAAGDVVVYGEDRRQLRRTPMSGVQLSERFRRAPRRLSLPDGAYCEVSDHHGLSALLTERSCQDETWLSRLNHWRGLCLSLAVVLVTVFVGYAIGLPLVAGYVARQVPESVENQIGGSTLASFDEKLLSPTKLSFESQHGILGRFNRLRLPGKAHGRYRIFFREGGAMGANAFALPGGIIVITDELVALAKSRPDGQVGLMGILAHEAAHIDQRHGLQQVVQASAVAGVVSLFLGDFSTLLATLPAAMVAMEYSRDHEREADRYAIKILRMNKLSTKPMAGMLLAMEASRGQSEGSLLRGELFSTHPLTSKRVDFIEKGDSVASN